MTDAIRTPDPLLEGLPDFPYAPRYRTVGGLRLAHVDEGEGAPVVMWHGEPTWGFLWRHVLPPVRDAGHRVVLPDLAGFGRSDKPLDPGWYSYDRHVEIAATLLEDLDLRDATFVVHDWGGPIGLRLAVEHPDRVARLVLTDTGLFTGEQPMSDSWHAFADFVARTEDLPVGMLVRRACHRDPGDEVAAPGEPAREVADQVVADVGAVEGDDQRLRPGQPRHPAGEAVVGVDEVEALTPQQRPQPPRRREVLAAPRREGEEVGFDPALAYLIDLVPHPAPPLRSAGVGHEVGDDEDPHRGEGIAGRRTG